jgi:thioredoxin 1|tara:strand:+ start:688 stop:1008 length:321 start_codon:yes stop_codon:yes gene_type:complete
MNLEITDSEIDNLLSKGGITVLDFWAPWCGPCKSYGPIIEGFAKDNESRSDLHIRKINVDENPVMAQKHGIRSIPTTIIFKDGQLITKVPGVIQKNKLDEFVGNLS